MSKNMKKQTIKKTKKRDSKVFFLSDAHFPYVNKEAIKKIIKLIKKERPTHVIQCGDLLDMYSFSRYEKDANLTTPESELQQGLTMATKMWADIRKAAPRAKCYQLIGNHEDRLTKTIARKAPELMSLCKNITDLYKFPGVKVMNSSKENLEIDGVIYCHGWYTKIGDHMKYFGKSVVHGHTHRAGIVYDQLGGDLLWEMDCGFLADKNALPLQYTQNSYSKWITSVGIIENRQPRLFLLE